MSLIALFPDLGVPGSKQSVSGDERVSTARRTLEENDMRGSWTYLGSVTTSLSLDDWTVPRTSTSHAAFVDVDCTGGPVTIDLPDATANPWRLIVIRKLDASVNAITVDADTVHSQTINGATDDTISTQYVVGRYVSDESNWMLA